VHGARSGAPETYPLARRGGEHRAPQQMAAAVVQQPATFVLAMASLCTRFW